MQMIRSEEGGGGGEAYWGRVVAAGNTQNVPSALHQGLAYDGLTNYQKHTSLPAPWT